MLDCVGCTLNSCNMYRNSKAVACESIAIVVVVVVVYDASQLARFPSSHTHITYIYMQPNARHL